MSAERDIIEDLSAYLDGELPPADAHRVEARLARDQAAAKDLRGLRATRELLRAVPPARAPRGLTDAVLAEAHRRGLVGRTRERGLWLGRFSAAAVLALAAGLGAIVLLATGPARRSPPPDELPVLLAAATDDGATSLGVRLSPGPAGNGHLRSLSRVASAALGTKSASIRRVELRVGDLAAAARGIELAVAEERRQRPLRSRRAPLTHKSGVRKVPDNLSPRWVPAGTGVWRGLLAAPADQLGRLAGVVETAQAPRRGTTVERLCVDSAMVASLPAVPAPPPRPQRRRPAAKPSRAPAEGNRYHVGRVQHLASASGRAGGRPRPPATGPAEKAWGLLIITLRLDAPATQIAP